MDDFVITPPPVVSVPVRGGGRFPVRRVYCIGRNYAAHAVEMGRPVDKSVEVPFYFTKAPSTLVPSGSTVAYPPQTKDYQYEMELVVAIGEPGTPTPTGRTFVLGSVVDEAQSFSPVILPLGSHSDTLDTYGGGPGTVALHGWPDASVFGGAVSHGCIRVPADALDRLRQVPLGTLVRVDEQ